MLCAFLLAACAQPADTVTQLAPAEQAEPPGLSKRQTNRAVGGALIGVAATALLVFVLIVTSLDGAFDETT